MFEYKKSLGQNFLIDQNIVNMIVNKSQIDKDTLVIEIGAGSGNLSKKLVKDCGHLICFEIDRRLEQILNNNLASYNNKTIIIADFLKVDLDQIISNYNYKKIYVIANLPYYITTAIINKIVNANTIIDKLVIMVQKEVGLRLTAHKNSRAYNSLTVFLNYHYNINKIIDVPATCFYPQPKVGSVVVEFVRKEKLLDCKDFNIFVKLVRDSFCYKRKTLKNNLREYNFDIIMQVLSKYNKKDNVRAEELSLEEFVAVANELSKLT